MDNLEYEAMLLGQQLCCLKRTANDLGVSWDKIQEHSLYENERYLNANFGEMLNEQHSNDT